MPDDRDNRFASEEGTEKYKGIPLFHGMSPEELSDSLAHLDARKRSYRKGTFLLRAGSTTRCMGIVLSGSVTIESTDLCGNCTILSHIGPGGIFAETYACLEKEVLLVDVRANEDCVILFLSTECIKNQPSVPESWQYKLVRNLLMISARKNLLLSGRSFHTASRTIRGKVLAYLHSISLQTRSDAFDIPFDRQQLADYLNVDRTALSKELGKMKREGIITFRRNHFGIRPHYMDEIFP